LSEKLGYFSNPKISAGFGSQGMYIIIPSPSNTSVFGVLHIYSTRFCWEKPGFSKFDMSYPAIEALIP
jgi:hypothetical protein